MRRHDIRSGGLPRNQFDLAHVRLVLMHLPEAQTALRRIVNALKPGGWLVAEEFDCLSFPSDPAASPGEIQLKVRQAFDEVLLAAGVDLRYGRSLPHKLLAHGLVDVGVEANASLWGGNSVGANLMKLSFEELRESMIRRGLISQAEFEADLKRVDEHDFLIPSPVMWTAWGKKSRARTGEPAVNEDFISW